VLINVNFPNDGGVVNNPNYVVLMREVRKEGRSVARVNGRTVNISLLKELGGILVDIHGQAEHLSLLDSRAHLGLLDRFAEISRPLSDYRQTYHTLLNLRRELTDLRKAQADADRKIDMLTYQAEEIEAMRSRIARIPFVEEVDLRYRHRVKEPQPISRAVMFCLMDVSASMTEDKKDLAKRFFTLLYLFLSRKYEKVELIFIRHTDDAQEVDEDTFFHDTKSGGTVVLSALKLMQEIAVARYPSDSWNIYGAQVSDGDAFGADPEKSRACLVEQLLPLSRYFAYIEVPDQADRPSPLTHAYQRIDSDRFAMKSVMARNEVYPVLRELFKREATV